MLAYKEVRHRKKFYAQVVYEPRDRTPYLLYRTPSLPFRIIQHMEVSNQPTAMEEEALRVHSPIWIREEGSPEFRGQQGQV